MKYMPIYTLQIWQLHHTITYFNLSMIPDVLKKIAKQPSTKKSQTDMLLIKEYRLTRVMINYLLIQRS